MLKVKKFIADGTTEFVCTSCENLIKRNTVYIIAKEDKNSSESFATLCYKCAKKLQGDLN